LEGGGKVSKGLQKVQHNIKIRLDDLMWEKRIPSITALSEATNITRSTLVRLRDNKAAGINLDTLEKLCNYLDIEITELMVIKK
jgi:putative transcriptional regulator